jgi:predicted nucleic acid-binding protein
MNGVFIDSCVLLDLFTADPRWADWSESMLERYSQTNSMYINAIVYAEVSVGFDEIEALDQALSELGIKVL